MDGHLATKDYNRQTSRRVGWRLQPILRRLAVWVEQSPKKRLNLLLVEAAPVSGKSLADIRSFLRRTFPQKEFEITELPFESEFLDLDPTQVLPSGAVKNEVLIETPEALSQFKADVVISIFHLHELLNYQGAYDLAIGKSLVKKALGNIKTHILVEGGLLIVVDGVTPYGEADKKREIEIVPKDRTIVDILRILGNPVSAYLPVNFDLPVIEENRIDLTLEQYAALIYSSKYPLRAIRESRAMAAKFSRLASKHGVGKIAQQLHGVVAGSKKSSRLLRNYMGEATLYRLQLLFAEESAEKIASKLRRGGEGLTKLFLPAMLRRWQRIERHKRFYYFSTREWKETLKKVGFRSISIDLISDTELEVSAESFFAEYPRNAFVYGREKRTWPYGHGVISAQKPA